MRNRMLVTIGSAVLSIVLPVNGRAASLTQPDSRLPDAVKRGDKDAVVALLRAHTPVDSPSGDGSTALHWAAYQDDVALAELLLASHANVSAVTRDNAITPLLIACQNGSASMIELLLKHGADANQPNALGTTPLMMASASGSVGAVKALLAHGAKVDLREHVHEQTALMFAANLDRGEVIRTLIASGADPNAASKLVTLPKMDFRSLTGDKTLGKNTKAADIAKSPAPGQHEPIDEKLASTNGKPDGIAQAASPSASAQHPGKEADKQAADAAEIVKKMYREHGAKMMGGMTPLLYAARQGNLAAALALVEGGAKIDQVSGSEHTTPLVLAIANGHLDLARMLVEHGANVNLANDMGVTPLFATVDVKWVPHEWSPEPIIAQEKTSYLELMKLLLAHGADPNARLGRQVWSRVMSENRNWTDPAGATAFWRAAQADDVDAMKLLKEGGADPNIPSKNNTTPLMVAAGLGWAANYSTTAPTRMAAVQYCLSLGADVTKADDLGYTALHGAGFVGDLELIHYLVDHGAKTDVRNKAGDTVADAANGLFEKSLPNPEAVALLEKLGSPNSHNCRSSDCVPPTKEDKPAVVAAAAKPDSTNSPQAAARKNQ